MSLWPPMESVRSGEGRAVGGGLGRRGGGLLKKRRAGRRFCTFLGDTFTSPFLHSTPPPRNGSLARSRDRPFYTIRDAVRYRRCAFLDALRGKGGSQQQRARPGHLNRGGVGEVGCKKLCAHNWAKGERVGPAFMFASKDLVRA